MEYPPDQFEKVTTLLKLKRYETPPPGYFVRFSTQVIARIEVLSERQPSWLKRFWIAFEARPSVAASCGVALGALLVTGFVLTQQQPDERLPWEGAGMGVLGQTPSRANLDVVDASFGLAIPQAVSNALAPAFMFGENTLRASTLNHWR
jgi:hypothetical protein